MSNIDAGIDLVEKALVEPQMGDLLVIRPQPAEQFEQEFLINNKTAL